MESAKHALILVFHGIKDCFCGILSLIYYLLSKESTLKSENIQHFLVKRDNPKVSVCGILKQCIVFGLLFWISIFAFNHFLLNDVFQRFAIYMGQELDSVAWLPKLLYYFFCLTWIFPLLMLSKILNYFWYQDIADLTFKTSGIKKGVNLYLSDFYADQIKSFILQVFYCVQGYAVYLLPLPALIQNLWYLFHLSLLSSLYAFEYKWVYMGWTLSKRLLTIDRKWPYFLGFGLPLAALTTSISSFIGSMILFATVFPIYVISSTVTFDSQSAAFPRPFHSFRFVDSVSDAAVIFIFKIIFGIKNIQR